MSEEILRAMMELFALIVKQDGGMMQEEMNFVSSFLTKELPHQSADEFMGLFLENAGPLQPKGNKSGPSISSVKDSIRIFNNCKKINNTLTQQQRVIVLMRCFELIDSDKQYTPQRMNILNTIAEVFRVSQKEFNSIMSFVKEDNMDALGDPSMIIITADPGSGDRQTAVSYAVFLEVASVNLYFLRSFCSETPLLNSLPMQCRKVYLFAPGSSLQLPPIPVVYYSDITSRFAKDEDQSRISFVARNLNYVFPDGAAGITDVSFFARGGNLIGILGASGSGKTTLMNMLTGLSKPDSGDVMINGISLYFDDDSLDGVIGYVPQDDLLVEELTVFENLWYAALLCSAGRSRDEIRNMVNQTLHALGLSGLSDLRVGSPLNKIISGGQRKRLNIALELIREPSVLFLDEPTSGLSSGDSENVMALLHELTLKGKLVMAIIHQPSSDIFKALDRVLVLDHGGYQVYYGNPIESIVHFKTLEEKINSSVAECPACGTVNPDTLFNILETRVVDEFGRYTDTRKVSPAEWAEAFRRSVPGEKIKEERVKPGSTLRRPGWLSQTLIFTARDVRGKIANRQYLLLTLIEGPALGLILSFIIRYIADPSSDVYIFRENENLPVYIFMSIIVALFLGLTLSAGEIFRDRKMLRREHFLHLNRSSYLLGKISVLVLISALQTLLFLAVANPILGIRDLFLSYWVALFVTAFCANMIGLNISSALNSAIAIYIAIPLLMIPMMILSGAMFPFDKLNRKIASADKVPLIAEFMPTRWTYEALMVRQFKENDYESRVYGLKQQISISDFNTVYRIPRMKEAIRQIMIALRPEGSDNSIVAEYRLLLNEVQFIGKTGIIPPFPGVDSISPALFSAQLGNRLINWISSADSEFRRRGNLADKNLDNYIVSNKEFLNLLYDNHHNDKLEDIVRKVYEKNKMLKYRDHLIQNADLIYLDPVASGPLDFRTHFMAPVKSFAGRKIDTFRFNILLVLSSVIVLFIFLQTEALRRIIELFKPSGFKKGTL